MQSDYDNNLQSYFTDMEHLRGMFKDFVSMEKLPKRLIVFHGVGGVGKSSLLRMFRLHCKSEKVPVALASGDDTKSVLDVIARWAEDLKEDGIKFPAFGKTMEAYRAIQAKVEDQTKKSQNKVADIASKAASKTAETAGGALLGAAIGSIIPGVGTAIGGALGGVVSGMGAEALTDWLRGFLSKPDIDLLLDPAKKLSADFLEDIAKAAEKKRMVLLLDTFEQMSALEDWVGETAQKIHPNVLMVIAGRKLPDWQRIWSGWMMNAQVEELKPMTEEIMRQLIRRYYATMRGGEPDPVQVDAIIKFARGLPMVVTSAVQLWVKYGVEDFQSVKAEIVANLVDRLMEGVPSALIPALEAAAVVRWFDQPILRAVMNKEDVREVYNELRRFPFVRTRVEGLALHDSVREMMDENLHVQDSERHTELHERAAVYFEKKLEKATGEDAERLGLERLYHRVRADEETGMKLFQEMAEELTQYRLTNRLIALLNDANTYPLEHENSKSWREYYNARLLFLLVRFWDTIALYERIGYNNQIESKLRAYALCDLADLLTQREISRQPGILEKSLAASQKSLDIAPVLDSKTVLNYRTQSDIYFLLFGDWEKAFAYLDKVRDFYHESGNKYGEASAYRSIKTLNAVRGDWQGMYAAQKRGLDTLSKEFRHTTVYAELIDSWSPAYAWSGRYSEAENNTREGIKIVKGLGEVDIRGLLRDLGVVLAVQNKFREADEYFQEWENLKVTLNLSDIERTTTLRWRSVSWIKEGKLREAEKTLTDIVTTLETASYTPSMGEVLTWLGLAYEIDIKYEQSITQYQQSLNYRGRQYFECAAFTGLIRVKHAQGDISAIPPLLAEAEQLAQQYEYNDHLASLRLTQGHLKAETSEVSETSEVLTYYKQAMVYALRYNRFLLDELLSGRPQGTPLRPIIPYCLERGEEGKKILSALCDWWQTGINDIGTPRPDTISPIPEGISLLEAEKIARKREPGDGSVQRSVLEQLKAAIGK